MEPLRDPAAVGVKVTDKVQLPAADTLGSQLFDSAKSPLAVIEEISSAELPMLRSRTLCAEVVEPICCEGYCREYGSSATDGAEFDAIFITNASVFPPATVCKAVSVTGKLVDSVETTTKSFFLD